MAVTRLQRREKRVKIRLEGRQKFLKNILKKPVVKNVDVEKIKESLKNE